MTNSVLLQALTAFIDKDTAGAVGLLEAEIKNNPSAELHDKLAAIFMSEGKYVDVLKHEEEAVCLDKTRPQYFVRKGLAEFHLKQFSSAVKSLTAAADLVNGGAELSQRFQDSLKTTKRKCQAEMEDDSSDDSSDDEEAPQKTENGAAGKEAEIEVVPGLSQRPTQGWKFKHDYYQTPTNTVVTIFAKHKDPSLVTVNFNTQDMSVGIENEEGSIEYDRTFYTYGDIIPDLCTFKVLSTKIEINLKKSVGYQWMDLERTLNSKEEEEGKLKSAYSSKKDWNRVEKEIEAEEELTDKPEGDEAMNKLFSSIYSKASDDTRRAMNKSFQESGGTVLSTNWDEVAKEDYKKDRTAPDSMEWKTWDGDKIPTKEKKYGKK